MPLPSSGPISFNDLNVALLRTATNQLTMSDAADNLGVSYNTSGTDQLGINEFYGKSYTGYAYNISVSPSTSTVAAGGQTITYTYTSDGTFGIFGNPAWATPSIQSGSAGTNLTFTITYDSQALDALARSATINLQSPLATTRTITANQSANPATLSIVQQSGPLVYDYRGGETEVYKVETSPESQITWLASLSDYTNFSHKKSADSSFSTSNLSGTGDTNIYVKGNPNTSITTDVTATITVDPQNIVDPNVTDTVTVLKKPNAYYKIDIGGGNWQLASSVQFGYNSYGIANAQLVRIYSNQSIADISPTLVGGNTSKFTYADQGINGADYKTYKIYANEFNGSGASYTSTLRVTHIDLNFDLAVTQTAAPAPTVDISPTSYTWAYTDTSNIQFTATVNNFGNPVTSVNFSTNSPYFRLVDYSGTDADDGGIAVSNPNGNYWVGSSNNTGNYSIFKVYARPTGTNSSAGVYSTSLIVTVGNTSGNGSATATLYQNVPPAFTSADWNGTITISSLGSVSVTNGNSTTTVGVSPTSFGVVTSNTTRTVTISNVTVPSGYSNAGSVLANFTRTATQPAAPRTLTLSPSGTTTVAGTATSVNFTIDDVYYTDTSWTLSTDTYGGYSQLGSVAFQPSNSGTGDGNRVLTFSQNTSGVDRANRVNLTGGATAVVIQNSYTPGPSFSSYTFPSSFAWNANGSGNEQMASFIVSGVHSSVQFYLNSPDFKLIDYSGNAASDGGIVVSNPNGNYWVGSTSFAGYYEYKVYVRPVNINYGSSDLTTTLTMTLAYTQNGGGSSSQTGTLRQLWYAYLSASPSSLSFVASSPASQTVNVSSNLGWSATVSGTGFEISGDNSTFGTSAVSKSGNNSVYVRPTTNGGGARTGTLTITGNSPYSGYTSSTSLSQDAYVSPSVCEQYLINNPDYEGYGFSDYVTFINCAGSPDSISVSAGGYEYICVEGGTIGNINASYSSVNYIGNC